MHIPDGFLSAPVALGAFALSGAAGAFAARRIHEDFDERRAPLLGVTAAFVFAAQMINFPVAAGTSGHAMGAAFASIVLGPYPAFMVMAVVLALQALMFADGGVTALGANLLNMGVVCLVLYPLFAAARAPRSRGALLAASAVYAWLTVVAAAILCAVELWLSGVVPLSAALPAMAGVHAIIGAGEAVITAAAVSLTLAARPGLVNTATPVEEGA
ncbi:MAG: energy-coupling factor ABC transporter permease [Nitrospinae bacterium]|nr:energy-coupling factor ABC transporter permease [Nitrospinota bacterium]